MRSYKGILLMALACLLVGCQTGEIGASQTNTAFPAKTDADVRNALKDNPEALRAYEETKARDAAVEAENHSSSQK